MIHHILTFTWSLAALLGAVTMKAGDDPEDPYLWLEEVLGERPMVWVKARNAESLGALARSDEFRAMEGRIRAILDSDERIPMIDKEGDYYYNFWRDAKNPRGLWRRTTLDEYRKEKPTWEVVLNLDDLARREDENWVWHGAEVLRPGHRRALVSLSRGGADAAVVREFDLEKKAFIADGYRLPEAKSRVAWRDENSVFVGTDFGPGSLTDSGYPRVVKEWRHGTPLASAATVYEGRARDMSVDGHRDLTPGFERDIITRTPTFFTSETYLRRDGRLIKIDKPDDARASFHREWLMLRLRTDWSVDGKTYPAGALLAIHLEAFLKGDRAFDVLFEPTERRSLAGVSPTRHFVILNELDNVQSRIEVLSHRDGQWHREPMPGLPGFVTASASAVDADDSDDYFLTVAGFLTPTTLSMGTAGGGPARPLKHLPALFKSDGLTVTQHETASKDGTRIPYFQVARGNLALDGRNPTLITGYGGFQLPRRPVYDPVVGAAWLEKGGVFVLANIRGGGEFGPKWHRAALKANRHKAYEDFIAVAEDLVRRNVTSPPHLGATGRSNGGLLMGNMLTRRPDLFGAIVCGSPLLDMKRYSHLLAGASWMGEYGNPDVPEEWAFIRTFSPYHNVEKSAKYPKMLITTSTRDDRVHPGHARKMAAKMLEQGHKLLYYENIEGGHSAAADNKQRAFMDALDYMFLWHTVGRGGER